MTDKPEYPSTKRYKRRKGNGDTYASIWLLLADDLADMAEQAADDIRAAGKAEVAP